MSHIHDRNNQVSVRDLANSTATLLEFGKKIYDIKYGDKRLPLLSITVSIKHQEESLIFYLDYGQVDRLKPVKIHNRYIESSDTKFSSSLSILDDQGEQFALHSQFSGNHISVVSLKS